MADKYYTINTFYRTDDVNKALVEEKMGFFSLSNPLEKKGTSTQYMAKEYNFQDTSAGIQGIYRTISFNVKIFNYGKYNEYFMVNGWKIRSLFTARILRDSYRIHSNRCEFDCFDPNGRKVHVKFDIHGCSFIKALWVTIYYLITKEPFQSIPSDFEMPKSYLENYFYSHYSF